MNDLQKLESNSIQIIREAYACFKNMGMLWSIGKDSTVLLWLTRKAFFGHVPFPLIHIDTNYKIPEMIRYRDDLVRKWKLKMVVGSNTKALADKETYPDGNTDRLTCCKNLKSEALKNTLNGYWRRQIFDHDKDCYVNDENRYAFQGVIVGIRADEEGSRSKERYFSARNYDNDWEIASQPPEFWSYFKTDFAPGTHVRIHPLLDWTELDIWRYIEHENIPMVSLYYDQGDGKRYRSLGCGTCTFPIDSTASSNAEIIEELESGQLANIGERSGRAQDKEDGGLETLRKNGYM